MASLPVELLVNSPVVSIYTGALYSCLSTEPVMCQAQYLFNVGLQSSFKTISKQFSFLSTAEIMVLKLGGHSSFFPIKRSSAPLGCSL